MNGAKEIVISEGQLYIMFAVAKVRDNMYLTATWHIGSHILRKGNNITQHNSYDYIWWRQKMETFSVSPTVCAGNPLVTGEFPLQRPVTRSFGVLFDLRLNMRLGKQGWGWWFGLPNLKFGTFVHLFSMLWHSCLLLSHGRSLSIVLNETHDTLRMVDFLINTLRSRHNRRHFNFLEWKGVNFD